MVAFVNFFTLSLKMKIHTFLYDNMIFSSNYMFVCFFNNLHSNLTSNITWYGQGQRHSALNALWPAACESSSRSQEMTSSQVT